MSTEQQSTSLFDTRKYIILAVGAAIAILGYFMMSGGGTEDPNVFEPDEIFSPIRITLAPYMAFIGYTLIIVAIMIKRKK